MKNGKKHAMYMWFSFNDVDEDLQSFIYDPDDINAIVFFPTEYDESDRNFAGGANDFGCYDHKEYEVPGRGFIRSYHH